ncbi:TetR/AcrR family transcriptional regulator [Streptacidiphilus pinicola]|uniref:TetR/AcrR family transcriptional regulator n=1 Tax=Streptacidiphilus pinicola TaxID=2219663 RepID=A0A2X0K1Q5_9ACTN|nr:TetR/AcrR family transcriptional regulator [Streptacidiphilus pinicola]RAG81489.1 TetR/AcrR family transcriptional regulator [Streptacidiphilus pinicola]
MTAETRAPRPMRADARRNYEKLVAVATESFLANGPDASLDDIAKRAGVGPGTLYRHFPNREALLDAVCVQWADSVAADAAPLLTAEDPTAALNEWLVRLVDHVGAFKGLASALLLSADRKHDTAWVLHHTSEELVERAKAAGGIRADVTTSELMQLTSGVTYACGTSKAMKKPSSSPERLIGLIMDGVRLR